MTHHPYLSAAIFRFVAPDVVQALRDASESLTKHGIKHAIVGGFAVGAYGHIRATKDVDFLVGNSAFIDHNGFVTLAPGVPFNIRGVAVDMVSIPPKVPGLIAELEHPDEIDGLPIVSPEGLVVMKLVAKRAKDIADVVALVEAGVVDREGVEDYACAACAQLEDARDLMRVFDRAVLP